MNKKKVSAVLIAGVLSIGAIGGTLAWFTSQDSVINAFQTAGDSSDIEGDTDGIKIVEDFDKEEASNIIPGNSVKKEVSVLNTSTYNQLIRVKLEKVWKFGDIVVTHYIESEDGTIKYFTDDEAKKVNGAKKLDRSLIQLNLGDNVTKTEESDKWINGKGNDDTENWHYYNGIVEPGKSTINLLESVDLATKTSNIYKNLNFDVIVRAESVQATNNAISETWGKDVPKSLIVLGGGTITE